MARPDILKQVRGRIENASPGDIFIPADFSDLAEARKITMCLSRLHENGTIEKVKRGVYMKPRYSMLLNRSVPPREDAVAKAIARNYGWTIVPCGDTALNLLGLSTQVPAVWSYVSDGAYKEYSFDSTTIKFKRTTNKEISKLSPKTALVIQAIKALGKEHVTDGIIEKIRSETSACERTTMLKEAQYATAWIYGIIKVICR